MRGHHWKQLGKVIAWAATAILLLDLSLLTVVWLLGGVRTQGAYLDWAVVSALAAVGSTGATVMAVGALAFAGRELDARSQELRRQADNERASRMPYLRVDLGFAELWAPGFFAPSTSHVFRMRDFELGGRIEALASIEPNAPPYDAALTLILWVQNLQTHPVGTAFDIEVGILIAWDESDPDQAAFVDIDFTYVEPGAITAIEIYRVRRDIPWLHAEVMSLGYEDLVGEERLPDAHGAMRMRYDRTEGVRNDRRYDLSRAANRTSRADGRRCDRPGRTPNSRDDETGPGGS
ncbi:MAG: hypothetical protein IT303_17060 [Dehalococcoidia bacterium]|nr:hypothetical protein [Dehalococcoidia bacterium]